MFAFALAFPALLLLLALVMQRIEQPLRDERVGDRVVDALGNGHADDVERLVTTDAAHPVERYWRRQQRLARLRSRRRTRDE
jgi:hypothetical protein